MSARARSTSGSSGMAGERVRGPAATPPCRGACARRDPRTRVVTRPPPGGTWSATEGGVPTTELLFGAGVPGLGPPLGPPFTAAPPPPRRPVPREPPDRSVPALDDLVA